VKRPPDLIYALHESPPLAVTALNGVQHVGLIAINLVYPVLIFRVAGVPTAVMVELISIAVIVLGLATFLQARQWGLLGSGYLCPATFTAAYLSPSLLAVKTGGLPLLFGMTIFAGALECVLARFLHRLRAILPTELSGFVIFMIGISAGIAGLRSLLSAQDDPVNPAEWGVGFLTLATMVSFNVWGKGAAKILCALIGLTVGYVAAILSGLLGKAQIAGIESAPWLALPTLANVSWSFDIALAASFAVACLAAAMKAVGTIVVCQRMNDAEWVRPEMESTTRGVLADGASTMLAGAMGAVGTNTSTPSVGLASATGVASRKIAYAIGVIFIILGLTPKLVALVAVMPRAVMVAALLFAVCFIIINGMQVMTSRLLDARRTIVIGLSVLAGTAVEVFPVITAAAPKALAAIIGSALVFSTLIALVLNLVFRIGVRKKVELTIGRHAIDPKDLNVEEFLRGQGKAWGARPEVIERAIFGVNQLLEAVVTNCWRDGPLKLEASFDEFNLDVRLTYSGDPLEFPHQRPSEREIIEAEDGTRRLAGYMLRRNADRVRSEVRNGRVQVLFHFDH
jgi:NCS2 family nucleobase:cation symporter-2